MAITIDDMRAVDMARSYGWEINFPSYGGAFFPATSMTDVFAEFVNGEMEYGAWTFSFPEKAKRGKTLTFEIYEVATHDVYQWLVDWKKSIHGGDFTTMLLGQPDVARPCVVQRLDLMRNPVKVDVLYVIPDGEFTAQFSSEKGGAPLSISATFTIVGLDNGD